MSLTILLPEPPSTNRLFTGSGRRYKTKAYKAWEKEADGCVIEQRALKSTIRGPYTVRLELSSKSRRDADNCVKGAVDFLVRLAITDDDKHCKEATAIKLEDVPQGTCRVHVAPWVAA